MPSKTATSLREKAVLVAVYVETPRKRRLSTNNGHHHHHHLYVHKPRHGANSGGYNRRAELLDYSRRLRESAKAEKSPLLHQKPVHSITRSRSQIIPVKNRLRPARVPACFGSLRIVIPGFLRSLTTFQSKRENKKKRSGESSASKMKSIVKRFQVKKKAGLLSKLFGSLRKHR